MTRACRSFGKLHEQPHAVLGARRAAHRDHRIVGLGKHLGGFLHRAHLAGRRRGRRVFRDIELLAVGVPDRRLLQARVERDHDRAVRRRHRDLVGAHDRLCEVLQRHRRVVPLGEVAHQRVDVLRRVDGRHARRPDRGVEIVAADHDHRHAVAPGVVDRHRRVLRADRAVAQRHHRLAGDLEVAVPHGDADFLMRHGEELRHLVLAVVDQRFMQAAEARGAVRRQILDVERSDHVDHEVGAGDAADPVEVLLRRVGLGGDGPRGRRQRRGDARGRGA